MSKRYTPEVAVDNVIQGTEFAEQTEMFFDEVDEQIDEVAATAASAAENAESARADAARVSAELTEHESATAAHGATQEPTAGRIPLYTQDGTLRTAAPVDNADAVPLGTLSAAISDMEQNIDSELISISTRVTQNTNAIAELWQEIINEDHFKGYYLTKADLDAYPDPTPNDYAWLAEIVPPSTTSNTWVYTDDEWQDSGNPIPVPVVDPVVFASISEAMLGVVTDKVMSPAAVKAAMAQFGLFGLSNRSYSGAATLLDYPKLNGAYRAFTKADRPLGMGVSGNMIAINDGVGAQCHQLYFDDYNSSLFLRKYTSANAQDWRHIGGDSVVFRQAVGSINIDALTAPGDYYIDGYPTSADPIPGVAWFHLFVRGAYGDDIKPLTQFKVDHAVTVGGNGIFFRQMAYSASVAPTGWAFRPWARLDFRALPPGTAVSWINTTQQGAGGLTYTAPVDGWYEIHYAITASSVGPETSRITIGNAGGLVVARTTYNGAADKSTGRAVVPLEKGTAIIAPTHIGNAGFSASLAINYVPLR